VTVTQQKKGARFTLDSLLLADFCCIKPRDKILEPGAGTGIVSILLAKKFPGTEITSVESQPPAVKLARRNVSDNDLDGRIALIEQDIKGLKKILAQESFDVIVTNPPYTKAGSGRPSPSASRQIARHDESADIAAWLDLQYFLKNKGRYNLIFPASRTAEVVSLMRAKHLEPKRARFIHPDKDKPASLVLIEAVKSAAPGLEILPTLYVHERGGAYSEEMKEIYCTPSEA
jgi:tRNA1Val (adenine37-N6)-methyltransferase